MAFDRPRSAPPKPGHMPDGRPIRIALFSGNYNYQRDGANLALNKLVDFLLRQGAQVLVFSPTSRRPDFPPTGELVSIPSIPFPGRKEYRLGLGLPAAARQRLEAFQPDIVHLSAPDWLGNEALKFACSKGWPVVASVHTRFESYWRYYGLRLLEPWSLGVLRRFYARCRQIYVPSESMAEALRAEGVEGDMRIWPRGVNSACYSPARRDPIWRARFGAADDKPVIAFVGRLVLEKGLDVVAEALDILRARGLPHRVAIVGDGPERVRLEARLPHAVFTGFLTGDDLAAAYASSDIFFFPSATETFGNVTLEAMASGVPTVCADATGSRSLVKAGRTGYLCAPTDARAFADALESLILDPDRRAQMGAAARQEALTYAWDALLGQVLASYRELLPVGEEPQASRAA